MINIRGLNVMFTSDLKLRLNSVNHSDVGGMSKGGRGHCRIIAVVYWIWKLMKVGWWHVNYVTTVLLRLPVKPPIRNTFRFTTHQTWRQISVLFMLLLKPCWPVCACMYYHVTQIAWVSGIGIKCWGPSSDTLYQAKLKRTGHPSYALSNSPFLSLSRRTWALGPCPRTSWHDDSLLSPVHLAVLLL
jgi:hypothetical protein